MYWFNRFLVILVLGIFASCQQSSQKIQKTDIAEVASTGTFGQSSSAENAIAAELLPTLFTISDTAIVTISGDISASCKHSGCWMDLDMGNQATVHVTFKDEAFTIPLDAAGKHAVAQGTAVRELIPVETLRNYAREEGKSDEDIAKITEPIYSYALIASGVLIEE